GRGMVADPGLALAIRAALPEPAAPIPVRSIYEKNSPSALAVYGLLAANTSAIEGRPGSATAFTGQLGTHLPPHLPWAHIHPLLGSFWALVGQRVERRHRAGRLKQWLNLLRRRYPEAQVAFDELRTTNDADDLGAWLLRGRG
ncbi:MAG: hypothetical protein Q8M78_07095, partial [Burkholderiaceae bacterium]|nr:hypothetical protein [Burkholderiaceae bacterium]